MLAALRHRGPDGEALFAANGAVLGAVRLAVIDVADGAQPMATADGRYVLAWNGAIVNHVELRSRLAAGGVRFRTRCDTEVLLHLLAREGAAGLARADGMFAGAFLDTQTGELLLFRDPCGIKPLYYMQDGAEDGALGDGARVLFASEPKAFFAAPGRDRRLHEPALLDYLSFQAPLSDATFFEGVRRVPPGTVLRLRRGSAPVSLPLPQWADPVEVPKDHDAAASVLRALLVESVQRHTRSDVPLGTHLSGGIDSSLIAALTARALGRAAPAFTGGFSVAGVDVGAFDERPHARAVAAELGAALHEFEPTPEDLAEALPAAAYAMDEPSAGPGLLPQWLLSRLASQHVKVVLGGQGGDELFGGYARYQLLALEGALAAVVGGRDPGALARMAPHLTSLAGYGPLMGSFFADGIFDPAPQRALRLFHRGRALAGVLTGDLRAALAAHRPEERFADAYERASCDAPGLRSPVGDAIRFDRAVLLPALLHVEDRTSMAWSIESRVPFLGRPVLSFVDRLPDAMLLPDGEPKALLRRAIGSDLPAAAAARRDKMGFPVPLTRWARGPLRDFFHDLLLDGTARSRGLFDPASVEALLGQESVTARTLWALTNVELWLRKSAS